MYNHLVTYQQQQEALFNKIEEDFKNGLTPSQPLTPVADFTKDSRRCLTGIVFLPVEMQQLINEQIIGPLKAADPTLFYYPLDSLHLTVKNVRVISDPPTYTDEEIQKSQEAFAEVIPNTPVFDFELKGLFDLPASVAIRGYSDEQLKFLIQALTQALNNRGIFDNKKYASNDVFFGNITFCRFDHQPNQAFQEKVRELKAIPLGTLLVEKVTLLTMNAATFDRQDVTEFFLKK